jgi:hypothetical protein
VYEKFVDTKECSTMPDTDNSIDNSLSQSHSKSSIDPISLGIDVISLVSGIGTYSLRK